MGTPGEGVAVKVPPAEPETNTLRGSKSSDVSDHEAPATDPIKIPGSDPKAPEPEKSQQTLQHGSGSATGKVDEPALIYEKSSEPKPKKSLQTLKDEHRISLLTFSRPKSNESVHAGEKRLSNKSLKTKHSQAGHSGEDLIKRGLSYVGEHEAVEPAVDQNPLAAPSALSQAGSILSRTYKEKELHVKVKIDDGSDEEVEDEDYEEWLEDDEYSEEGDEEEGSIRGRRGTRKKSKSQSKSAISFSSLHKNSTPTNRELAMEAYQILQMKTFADLLIAKARRPILLDAYCLGRGIIQPPITIMKPSYPDKSMAHDENILTYPSFLARLQELEEQNSHSLQQIVLVFTASLVSQKKTWSEDCNLIETAVQWMTRYLDADCNVLFIRTGTHSEWKDPANPFRTDKRLMLKSLPTITVWNTEKRLAGSRLFNLDNIAVLLED